jgi:hypothetical protein
LPFGLHPRPELFRWKWSRFTPVHSVVMYSITLFVMALNLRLRAPYYHAEVVHRGESSAREVPVGGLVALDIYSSNSSLIFLTAFFQLTCCSTVRLSRVEMAALGAPCVFR